MSVSLCVPVYVSLCACPCLCPCVRVRVHVCVCLLSLPPTFVEIGSDRLPEAVNVFELLET